MSGFPIVPYIGEDDDQDYPLRKRTPVGSVPIQVAQQDEQPPQMAVAKKGPTPITVPMVSEGTSSSPVSAAPISKPAPITSQLDTDTAELNRLKNSTSGIDQLRQRHPILGTLAKIGEVAGSILSPHAAAMIPGTQLHHDMLVGQQQGRVNADLGAQKEQAQIAELNSRPELAQAKLDAADAKLDATLRQHGFKHDAQGNVVPLSYDEMSQEQQAVHDLKASQQELADANTAYKKAQKDNIPIQMEMAKQRIVTAQKNAATAAGRLGLSQKEFEANYLGTIDGTPIGTTDENGNPVGLHVANANNATAQRLNKGDLAQNVTDNVDEAIKILQKRKDLLGKVAGRFTSASQMVGTGDPDVDRLGVIIHNTALASNGVHGVKGEQAVEDTERKLLNGFKNSPDATIAGLNELKNSMGTFTRAAHSGKKPLANSSAPPKDNGGGDFIYARDEQGQLHKAPKGTQLPKGWKEEAPQ